MGAVLDLDGTGRGGHDGMMCSFLDVECWLPMDGRMIPQKKHGIVT